MSYSILKILAVLVTLLLSVLYSQAIYCPHYCRCSITQSYKHVKCIGHNLISVELDIPRSVEWLELSNNSISELKDYIFQDLGIERIIILNLQHNSINSIGLKAFHGLENIREIDLSANHLYRIHPFMFEYNPLLEHLILSKNPLRNIPENVPFLSSNSLKNLEISFCRISYIPTISFSSLPSLTKLDISYNGVLLLNENLLDSFNNLIELNITHTSMKCDSSASYLLEWADLKSVVIIGSPCASKVELTDHTKKEEEPKKFEKMIMVDEPLPDAYDSYYDVDNESKECICSDYESSVGNLKATVTSYPEQATKVSKQPKHDRSMLWLAFLNGLVTGAALASSAITFWIYCCKYRTRRNIRRNRRNERTVTPTEHERVQCETPPPAYSELF